VPLRGAVSGAARSSELGAFTEDDLLAAVSGAAHGSGLLYWRRPAGSGERSSSWLRTFLLKKTSWRRWAKRPAATSAGRRRKKADKNVARFFWYRVAGSELESHTILAG